MKLLEISHLSKNYHDLKDEIPAIKDLNIEVNNQEFISIVGPSGCGKSTLLSILSGIDTKSSGAITFYKNPCKIGYMLQKDSLFPWKSVYENCLIGLEVEGKVKEEDKMEVLRLLKTYGLEEFKDKYPKSLSGGMRQRVALIRTLAVKPDILLLDEPFSALDYQTRLALSEDVYNIIKNEKKTAIMVTHDLAEAISTSDRVFVLSKRPATVKKIYEIHLTDKQGPIHNRKCPEFSVYYDQIWRDLDVHIES